MTTHLKQKLTAAAGLLLIALAIVAGCKKPSPLGAELLGDEFADAEFTDTISLRCTIEREDSSLTSDRTSTAEHFLCGELNDPLMGKSRSDLYAIVVGETLNPAYDTATQIFDSLVLYLRYAPGAFYGDTLLPQTLRVMRVNSGLFVSDTKDYYSTNSFAADEEIGRVENFLPRPTRRDSLFEGLKGSFLRIALKPEFGQELFALDSASYAVDSIFIAKLRGLKIVSSSNGASPGLMMAFNLNDNSFSRMRLFYHGKSDTTARNFDYFFKGVNKFTHFEHEHAGSPGGDLINQPAAAGDKIYVQGMQGMRVKIEFPFAHNLNDIAVNKAQLVLTVADENATLTPASQLFFTKMNDEGTFETTSDVGYSFGPTLTGGFFNFGGSPKKVLDGNTPVTRYWLTLSEEFQHMVDDANSTDTKKRTVYMGVYPRSRTAGRVVLYGPQSATFPARLELIYTRVR